MKKKIAIGLGILVGVTGIYFAWKIFEKGVEPTDPQEARRAMILFNAYISGAIADIKENDITVTASQPVGETEEGPYIFSVHIDDHTNILKLVPLPLDEYEAGMQELRDGKREEPPRPEKAIPFKTSDLKVGMNVRCSALEKIGTDRSFTATEIIVYQ